MSMQKACPRCRQTAPLDARVCQQCGHVYRTRFVVEQPESSDPTHVSPSRMPQARPMDAGWVTQQPQPTATAHMGRHDGTARRRRAAVAASFLVIACLAAFALGRVSSRPTRRAGSRPVPDVPKARADAPMRRIYTAGEFAPAVVGVVCDAGAMQAEGTGFFVNDRGHVLTNYHVVDGTRGIRVFSDGGYHTAQFVAGDPKADLALLVTPKRTQHYVTMGDQLDFRIGETVFTIGFPGGVSRSATPTIANGRLLYFYPDYTNNRYIVEADLRSMHGCSGSPVILARTGQAIGVLFGGVQHPGQQSVRPNATVMISASIVKHRIASWLRSAQADR